MDTYLYEVREADTPVVVQAGSIVGSTRKTLTRALAFQKARQFANMEDKNFEVVTWWLNGSGYFIYWDLELVFPDKSEEND